MRRISEKRRRRVEEGEERLGHNSTFGASKPKAGRPMTIAELKASGKVSKAERAGKSEKSKAKARGWKQFSMFIRLRDSGPDGYGQCVTCQRRAHWRTMDAGHYLTRDQLHAYRMGLQKPYGVGGSDHPKARAVIVEGCDGTIIGEWGCVSDCARDLGLRISCVFRVLWGQRKTHRGMIFKYADE